MTKRTGGEIIADQLVAEGVPFVCGIPGHGDMGIFDALKDRSRQLGVLQVRHEQSAGHIADAHFRASGRPIATVTSIGPGSANLAMSLATAYVDSQAVISFTGGVQTYMEGTGVLQEIERQHDADFPSILRPVTKRSISVHRADQMQRAVNRAFNIALTGRPGPVHIDVPIDVQSEWGEHPEFDDGRHRATHTRTGPDPDGIEQMAAILAAARRPVILAGGGCIQAGAAAALRALAERLRAPVVTTMMGKGVFPEDHPLCAQHTGSNGTACGNHFTATADVLLAVGTRFSEQTSSSYLDGKSFSIPPCKLLHIDADPREIGKNYPVEVGIVADARLSLEALLGAVGQSPGSGGAGRDAYVAEIADWRQRWFDMVQARWTPGVLSMSRAIAIIRETLPREAVVISSAGHPQIQMFQEFHAYEPRTWLTPGGYSTMGFTVPAAIGAKLACPDVPVVGVAGDGDFLMSIQELALAVQAGVPVLYVVLNNIGWVSIRDFQNGMFGAGREYGVEFRNRDDELVTPDFTKIAAGFGCYAAKVTEVDDLGPAIGRALSSQGPAVLEVMVDRTPQYSGGINSGHWDLPVPEYLRAAQK
jgi:acetolactate synthase I/II/III large subunit